MSFVSWLSKISFFQTFSPFPYVIIWVPFFFDWWRRVLGRLAAFFVSVYNITYFLE